MKFIIAFSVRRPMAVLAFTLVLGLLGARAALRLPLDAVPDITNKQIQVNTSVEGLAPVQIEQQVTFPIETALSGVPGVRQVRSISRPRLSQITAIFDDAADLYHARQMVAERLQTVREELPPGADPEMGPISTGLGEVYFYTLEAKTPATGAARVEQLMKLREIQEWEVKPRLLTVSGVAEVNTSGGFRRQAVVRPNLAGMAARGIQLDDLVQALRRANRLTGGGLIEQGAEQFSVAAEGGLTSLGAILAIPVKADQSLAPVRLSDMAGVGWEAQPRSGAATVAGREAMVNAVLMLAGENSRTVSSRIHARIGEIARDLPDWVELKTIYNRTDLVNATLTTVAHNLSLGAALVILVLFLLLGNIRAAVITALTIPLAMLFAVTVMVPLGISGNLMSLGAVDFGILVDGAVIVLDHCMRRIAERRRRSRARLSREELRQEVLDAVIEVRQAAGFGELIIVVALLPLFGLTGLEGKTFMPMAATLALALTAAFIVSFTVVPALAALWLSPATEDREPWLMRVFQKLYDPLLERFIGIPKKLALIAVGLIAVSLMLFGRLGAVFMPQLDEGSMMIQFIRPQTISLYQSLRYQEASEKIILQFPEVENTFSRIGTPELATDPMGVNLSDTVISLKPERDWPRQKGGRRRTKDQLILAIQERLAAELPGQRMLLSQPIQMRFNELLEGTRADVAVKIYGPDLAVLAELTEQVAGVIRLVRGAGDVEAEVRGTTPILSIRPKYGFLARLGVPAGGVLETVETAMAGERAGTFFGEGARRFPVMVRLGENERGDLDVIRSIPVPIGPADARPLHEVAEVAFVDSYNSISREQASRRAAILVNPRGRDVESFVLEAREKVLQAVKIPSGYHIEWGGSFENLRVARGRLLILTPLALGLVFGMIYAAFGRVKLTLLVFSGVPLALIGGILGLWIRNIPFSISAGVGFIALAGISVLNGVVLVSTRLRMEQDGSSPHQAIRESAISRLRPVLMTAMVEIFGFLPMMFAHGLGAEVQQPLATVIVCGVLSASALTLLMLPAWQLWLAGPRAADFPVPLSGRRVRLQKARRSG